MMESKSFIFRFGDVEVREREFSLVKAGEALPIEPKAFRVLLFLLHNPQRLIRKEELLNALWADAAVTESSLTRSIAKLRRVLGDDFQEPRYIETVPTVGYRFVAHVEERVESIESIAAPSSPAESEIPGTANRGPKTKASSRRWIWMSTTALALAVIAGLAGTVVWHRSTVPRIHSITVLPLQNLSSDPNTEYFADGMTEELSSDLAAIPELQVVSDSSTAPVKDSPESLTEVARRLGVDAVIEGSVLRSKDKVSLDIRLFDARSGRQLWAGRFEDAPANISALQKHVAAEIAARARVPLTPPQQARLNSAKPLDPSAYDGYLQGRYLLGKRDIDGAVKMFRRAVVLDPSYARSWAGLAAGLADLGMDAHPTQEPIPEAKAAARHAIEIDPDNGEAWSVLGEIALNNEWDWKTAEHDLQKAIALSPSDSMIELRYATFLSLMGRRDEAVSHMRRALELDPLSFFNVRHLGSILYLTRQYDESLEYLNRAREMEPELQGDTQGWITRDYLMKGLYDDAVMSDIWFYSAPEASGPALRARDRMWAAYRAGGPMAYWNAQIKLFEADNQSPCGEGRHAGLYVRVGENEKALEGLKRALDAGCSGVGFTWLGADPSLDPLRGDPRFKEILKRVNLGD
jgi:TolB-like protein/DNA-binding winged helix-turn-helix (wHTH) protein